MSIRSFADFQRSYPRWRRLVGAFTVTIGPTVLIDTPNTEWIRLPGQERIPPYGTSGYFSWPRTYARGIDARVRLSALPRQCV